MMAKPTEYPCKEIDGNVWYSFTAHRHTIGVSLEPGRQLDGVVETDDETGQITLGLVAEQGDTLTALGFIPKAEPRGL
jgi:uncharacterized protein YwbE